jgi:hypothetical protein
MQQTASLGAELLKTHLLPRNLPNRNLWQG